MPLFEVRHHGPVTEFLMGPTLFGRPLFPFRAYLVDGLLIDTGPPVNRREMARMLAEFPVRQVVNTHHHEDHAGNNALISELMGLTPAVHPIGVPLLQDLPPIQLYRKLTWGESLSAPAAALGEWVTTPRHRFRVVHTPGHAPDHVVLHEPEAGWLFTGDLYIADSQKLLRPEEDPHVWAESLAKALALDFDTVFCAHRGVVSRGHAALARKHAFLGELRERVLALHGQGLGEREIARRLLGREDFLYYFSSGDFSRRNLVTAFLPHWAGPAPLPSRPAKR